MEEVYVASSWRNEHQPAVVGAFRKAGFSVYDFRNPSENDHGFHWGEVDPAWEGWSVDEYARGLQHPVAKAGFAKDMAALGSSLAVVLVLPCGRSSHLELGWAIGQGIPGFIYCPEKIEPELMYKMAVNVYSDLGKVIADLRDFFVGETLYEAEDRRHQAAPPTRE